MSAQTTGIGSLKCGYSDGANGNIVSDYVLYNFDFLDLRQSGTSASSWEMYSFMAAFFVIFPSLFHESLWNKSKNRGQNTSSPRGSNKNRARTIWPARQHEGGLGFSHCKVP